MNEARHDAAWTRVWNQYYSAFGGHAGGRHEDFQSAVHRTTYLFTEAETDEDFSDALFQMREVLEMELRRKG